MVDAVEAVLRHHDAVEAVVVVPVTTAADTALVAYVQVRGGSSPWQMLFDDVYASGQPDDWTLDTRGWRNSVDRSPYGAAEMREWADASARLVLALTPRRVLEVGCGSGMLAWRIAPHVEQYVGTDFSPAVVAQLRRTAARERIEAASFAVQDAHALAGRPDGAFDVVIFNSMIQYLADEHEVRDAIGQALRVAGAGGAVVVGDVRDLRLLRVQHFEAERVGSRDALAPAALLERVERRVAQEVELVIDPAWFVAMAAAAPLPTAVAIRPRRGRHRNEMTRFRYDAVLRQQEPSPASPACDALDWGAEVRSVEALERMLRAAPGRPVRVSRIANARVADACRALRELSGVAAEPERPAVDPEQLWALGERLGRAASVELGGTPDELTAAFGTVAGEAAPAVRDVGERTRGSWTNRPLRMGRSRAEQVALEAELRAFVAERLPEQMVPAACVTVTGFPLTERDEVDRSALAARGGRLLDGGRRRQPWAPAFSSRSQ